MMRMRMVVMMKMMRTRMMFRVSIERTSKL